jgi:hypothetical protein
MALKLPAKAGASRQGIFSVIEVRFPIPQKAGDKGSIPVT